MKHFIRLVLAAVVMTHLASCSTAPKTMGGLEGKRVGILNLFQDNPRYSKFSTTTDEMSEAELPDMRHYLTQKLISDLAAVGVQAQAVGDHLPLLRNEVDVVLELQPQGRDRLDPNSGIRYEEVAEQDGSNGFGFYYKSLLVTRVGPEAYVTLQAYAVVNRGGELVASDDYEVYVRDKMNLEALPASWRQASDSEKQEMKFGLQRAIDTGVAQLIAKLDL